MKVRRADPPFPWEIAISRDGVEVFQLIGHFIGPSTYRSIFQVRSIEGTEGKDMASHFISRLGRDPLLSDYWTDETWSRFMKMVGISRDDILEINRSTLDTIG